MKEPTFTLVTLLVVSLLCSNLNQASHDTLSNHVGNIANIFRGCHYKVFGGYTNSTALTFFLRLLAWHASPISTVKVKFNSTAFTHFPKVRSHIEKPHYSSCFLHLYVEDELTDYKVTYKALIRLMLVSRRSPEQWPQHTIFFVNVKAYNLSRTLSRTWMFYKEWVPVFSKGLVLVIEHCGDLDKSSWVGILCPICYPRLQSFHLNPSINTEILTDKLMTEWLLHDNHEGIINANIHPGVFTDIQNGACNISQANFTTTRFRIDPAACALHVLQNKYNLSYILYDEYPHPTLSYFEATLTARVEAGSYTKGKGDKLTERVPYGWRSPSFMFMAFQTKFDRGLVKLLLKPYHWISWTIFCLAVVITLVVQLLQDCNVMRFVDALQCLLAIMLEQSVNWKLLQWKPFNNWSTSIRVIVWTLALSVLSNAYKGALFSMMTKNAEDAIWPKNLLQLTNDPAYQLLSHDAVLVYMNATHLKPTPMLLEFMRTSDFQGIPGEDYPIEVDVMNRTHVHFQNGSFQDIVSEISWRRQDNFENGNTFSFDSGNISTPKFAYIYKETHAKVSDLFTEFIPELIASEEVAIPGLEILLPWSIHKGYLNKKFVMSLAMLEQTGFFLAFERHRRRWQTCRYMNNIQEMLLLQYNMTTINTGGKIARNRCLNFNIAKEFAGAEFHESKEVQPLSLMKLKGLLHMHLVVLSSGVTIIVLEYIIKKCFNNHFKSI